MSLDSASSPNASANGRRPRRRGVRLLIFLSILATGFWLYRRYGGQLTLAALSEHEEALRQLLAERPLEVCIVAFLLYAALTGLSLPGAVFLSIAYGWIFGFWRGLLLVSFASTLGATAAFLLSRFLLRDAVQARFGPRLARFNAAWEAEGAWYLFALRLVPAIPFFVVNLWMGLTPIKTRTFWWVSQVGMLPATAVFLWAGAAVPSLKTIADRGVGGILSPQLLAALTLLGLFPLAAKRLLARFRRSPAGA